MEVFGADDVLRHNWGSQHAERWIWLQGTCFDGAPRAWLDLALARVRVAGATMPWIASGALSHGDGRRIVLGGLRARVTVDERPGAADVDLGAVRVRVRVPLGQTLAWVYSDPSGGSHHSLNCSIAELAVEHEGATLATAHGGVYERERDPGVAVAPYPDP